MIAKSNLVVVAAVIVGSLSAILVTSASRAALIAYDNFGYLPVGSDLNGKGIGGTSIGFAGAWAGHTSFDIGSESLPPTVAFYGESGRDAVAAAFTGNRDIGRTLTNPLGGPGTTRYVSFVMRPDGTLHLGANNGRFGFSLRGDHNINVVMGSSGDTYNLEVDGTTAQSPKNAVVGQIVLFILRFDFTAGADSVRLYVNRSPELPEPVTADASLTIFDVGTITSANLTGGGAFSFDGLRIAATFSELQAPEPATMDVLLTAFSLIGLVMPRERAGAR